MMAFSGKVDGGSDCRRRSGSDTGRSAICIAAAPRAMGLTLRHAVPIDRITVEGIGIGVNQSGQAGRGTVRLLRQSEGHGHRESADLLVGIVQVLVAEKAEQLVLDERTAESSARGVAVQFRNFLVGRECWGRR